MLSWKKFAKQKSYLKSQKKNYWRYEDLSISSKMWLCTQTHFATDPARFQSNATANANNATISKKHLPKFLPFALHFHRIQMLMSLQHYFFLFSLLILNVLIFIFISMVLVHFTRGSCHFINRYRIINSNAAQVNKIDPIN